MTPGLLISFEFYARLVTCYFDKDQNWTNQKSKKGQTESNLDSHDQLQILCANCKSVVTSRQQQIEMAGAHHHHVSNPQAQSFDIRLFNAANVTGHGITTTEFSWFPGYAWQVVLCKQCRIQLGWRFQRGDSPDFYGLIEDYLIEAPQ